MRSQCVKLHDRRTALLLLLPAQNSIVFKFKFKLLVRVSFL